MGGFENPKRCKCGKAIDEKYDQCADCFKKNTPNPNTELITAIGSLNNNAYAIRTILEEILSEKGKKLVWIKGTGQGTEKEKKGYFQIE